MPSLLGNGIIAYFNEMNTHSKVFEILKILAVNSMSIYLFIFCFFGDHPFESQGHSVPELEGRKNQRTFIFLFYGLVKHETYWQMLGLDISCHAISFKFIFTLNDSGSFYILKKVPHFFECLEIEKTDGHMTSYLFY